MGEGRGSMVQVQEVGGTGMGGLGQMLTPVPGLAGIVWSAQICICKIVGTDLSTTIGIRGLKFA